MRAGLQGSRSTLRMGVTSLVFTEPGTQSAEETADRQQSKAGSLGGPWAIRVEFLSKPKAVLKMQSLKKM